MLREYSLTQSTCDNSQLSSYWKGKNRITNQNQKTTPFLTPAIQIYFQKFQPEPLVKKKKSKEYKMYRKNSNYLCKDSMVPTQGNQKTQLIDHWCSASLFNRQMPTKPTIEQYITPKPYKLLSKKCLKETNRRFLRKLKLDPSYDQLSLSGIYPKEMQSAYQGDTFLPIFIMA